MFPSTANLVTCILRRMAGRPQPMGIAARKTLSLVRAAQLSLGCCCLRFRSQTKVESHASESFCLSRLLLNRTGCDMLLDIADTRGATRRSRTNCAYSNHLLSYLTPVSCRYHRCNRPTKRRSTSTRHESRDISAVSPKSLLFRIRSHHNNIRVASDGFLHCMSL